jgi:DNA-binding response OmpR family regulator
MHAGADDYLIKPFSARELLARISARLEIIRLQSEGEQRYRELAESLAGRGKNRMLGRFFLVRIICGVRWVDCWC